MSRQRVPLEQRLKDNDRARRVEREQAQERLRRRLDGERA